MGHTTGVIDYTIGELDPNTAYSFKVQAGNGCATGAWSNVLKAAPVSSSIQSFYRVGGSGTSHHSSLSTPTRGGQELTPPSPTPSVPMPTPERQITPTTGAPMVKPELPLQKNKPGMLQKIFEFLSGFFKS